MTGLRVMRAIFTAMRAVNVWWVWTARPFILHPIQTIKDHFRREPVSEDDLAHLTPEERKAIQ